MKYNILNVIDRIYIDFYRPCESVCQYLASLHKSDAYYDIINMHAIPFHHINSSPTHMDVRPIYRAILLKFLVLLLLYYPTNLPILLRFMESQLGRMLHGPQIVTRYNCLVCICSHVL